MAFRPDIIAGRAVILVNIEDTIDKQLRGIRSKLRRFSNTLGEVGGDLFRGGTLGVVGAIFPVKEFINFQDQLLFIQTKLQATDLQMMGLESTIRQLGKSTSFTSMEVGQSAQMLAQAGFNLQEVNNTLQASLDLARGGQVDLATATAILARSLRTFGKDASHATAFASKFITAARLGTLNIVDLSESLKESSGTFRALGVSLEDALALITQISNSSLIGTKAGTSLNTAFINLTRNATKLKSALGIEFDDLSDPVKVFTEIGQKLKTLDSQSQVSILADIFNIRGGRAASAVLIQGLSTLKDNVDKLKGSMDEARESAAKLDSRLGGVYRRALSSFQEFLLAAGGTSEGPLSKFGEGLRKAFNELSNLSTNNPELLQTIFLLPPVILAAGTAFIALSFALNKVAGAMSPLIGLNRLLFSGLAKIAGGNIEIFSKMGKGAKGLSASKLGILNVSTKDRSFLKFIASTKRALNGGILASLTKFIALSRRAAGASANLLGRGTAGAASRGIRAGLGVGNIAGAVAGKIPRIPPRVGIKAINAMERMFNASTPRTGVKALNLLETAFGKVTRAAVKLSFVYEKAFNTATTRPLLKLVGLLEKGFSAIPSRIGVKSVGLIEKVVPDKAITGYVKVMSMIPKAFAGVFRIFRKVDIVKTFFNVFMNFGKGIRYMFTGLNVIRRFVFSFSGILTIIEALILVGPKIKPVREFFTSIGDYFKAVAAIGPTLVPALTDIWNGFKTLFGGDLKLGIDFITMGLEELVFLVKFQLVNAWRTLKQEIKPILDYMKLIGDGLLQTFTTLFSVLGEILGFTFNKLGAGIGNLIPEGSDFDMKNAIAQFFNVIIAFLKQLGIQIIKFIDMIANLMEDVRQAIISILSWIGASPIKGGDRAQDQADRMNNEVPIKIDVNKSIAALETLSDYIQPAEVSTPDPISESDARATHEFGKAVGKGITDFTMGGAPEGPANPNLQALTPKPLLEKALVDIGEYSVDKAAVTPQFKNILGELGGYDPMREHEASKISKPFVDAVMRRHAPKPKELERTLTKIQSQTGSYGGTRGQLLKMQTRDKEIAKMEEIRVEVEKLGGEDNGPAFG